MKSGVKGIYWHRSYWIQGKGAWVVEFLGPEGRVYLGRFGNNLDRAKRELERECLRLWGVPSIPDKRPELDIYKPSPQEQAELDAMEYPMPGWRLLNQMMREAV